jgi:ATP-dependent protease HslVU (ClpYQ) ATPase subunit
MKTKLGLSLIATLATALLASSAFADRVDQRQKNQNARIKQGVQSGELTRGEAAKLRYREHRLKRAEHRAEKDGTVTAEEAAKLEKRQDNISEDIYKQKHDEQDRAE